MDTDALRTFLKIARIGSLTRAAELLGKSQPSLSRLVMSLEAEVGQPLLVRSRSGLSPTQAGELFQERALQLLADYDQLIDQLRADSRSLVGSIKIGIPHSFTKSIGLPLSNLFLTEAPEAKVELKFGLSHEIEQALAFGQIDIGILISTLTDAHLDVEPCVPDPLMVMVGKVSRYSELVARPIVWQQLEGIPLALPPSENQLRRKIDNAAQKAGIEIDPVFELGSAELTVELVSEGKVCTILPNSQEHNARTVGHVIASALENEKVVWSLATSRYAKHEALLVYSRDSVKRLLTDVIDRQRSILEHHFRTKAASQ